MTKAEQIIEKLNGEQKIIYGGIDKKANMQAIEVIPPKPILIGDCLEAMAEACKGVWKIQAFMELIRLWQPLGFTKSLQELELTPQASALILFLYEIFND